MSNTQTVASKTDAIKYITEKLTTSKLVMADATRDLGWTFPRIRSRAKTICKKLNGSFVAESRGVYVFVPHTVSASQESEGTNQNE